jgi:hypothetical protein
MVFGKTDKIKDKIHFIRTEINFDRKRRIAQYVLIQNEPVYCFFAIKIGFGSIRTP